MTKKYKISYMIITTWNLNGIRSALKKGFDQVIKDIDPDILLLQEVRALPEQIPAPWDNLPGYHTHWNPAAKKGYAGTAIISKHPIKIITTELPNLTCDQGRLILAKIKNIQVASIYLPSGSSGTEKQVHKEAWMENFLPFAKELASSKKPVILAGDFNIAHTEKDIFYAKANSKKSGFLPHERQWLTDLLATGYNDHIRDQAGDIDGPYSWWSNRGQAKALDRGWRIDYLLGNNAAKKQLTKTFTDRQSGITISDHAPLTIHLED